MHKREKGCPYRFTSSESERERERAMREEAELASPGAAIVARRESRSAMPERLKVAARDDSSDVEWDSASDARGRLGAPRLSVALARLVDLKAALLADARARP